MVTSGEDDGHDLGVAATRFHRAMRQNVADALGPFGLTGAEYGALHYLSQHADPSQSELARYLMVTPQSLGTLTARLDDRGLLARVPAERAHRYCLALTSDGERALADARPSVEAAQQRLLAPLDPDERMQLARALTLCSDRHDDPKDDHP